MVILNIVFAGVENHFHFEKKKKKKLMTSFLLIPVKPTWWALINELFQHIEIACL
ncbi:MAG: hypothetical protein WBP64_20625 [Nitrososphaeraceae archaeon]